MANIDYSKSKVYKIWSTQGNKIYIGATTKNYLSQRMTTHRKSYTQWKKGNHSNTTSFTLFEEYGIENCYIELLEAKPCCSKDELSQIEGKYIRELECVNKVIPGRTVKEYRDDTKEIRTEKQKQYYKDNAEHIKEISKKYQQDNKEARQETHKKYYQANKDKIKERVSITITCECGSIIKKSSTRHQHSIKHKQYLESV